MILDKIVADKRKELEQTKAGLTISGLMERMTERERPLSLADALRGTETRLIAEVKKASPSKGVLCPDFRPVKLAKTYARSGAAAISVLTEANYFQGSIEHLAAIRREVSLPLLRKDFIFDPYQVYEAAAYGADALLLIVAILDQRQLEELLSVSRSVSLSCLVEVHNESEVEQALRAGAEIIGINNRDLNTFKVDIETSRRLRPLITQGRIVVSESGIGRRGDVEKLKTWGVNAVLVGEALVTAADIPAKIRELIS